MSQHYILEGKNAVPADLLTWARWFEKGNRIVAQTEEVGLKVSTVFLGLDHAFGGPVPLLYETMVFGGEHDQDQERYTTWEQAEEGHKAMCAKVFV